MAQIEKELGWLFVTSHSDQQKGVINYIIWSDILLCSECNGEIVFWDAAVDWKPGEKGRIASEFSCPNCNADLNKKNLERAFKSEFDQSLNTIVRQRKMKPVRISYKFNRKNFEKDPDKSDLALIEKANSLACLYWFPAGLFMNREGKWG